MTLSEAREEVKKCDQEIQSIKAALRGIGNANSSEPNSLEIEFIKVEGLPESAKPTLSLQLSSPIEERELTLNGETKAIFTGVEISMATLTVDAKDADIPLGTSSNPIDIAPLCALDDPKRPKDEYVTEVPIAIVAAATTDTETATDTEGGEVQAEPVVCSVTLRVTYKPSPKDQREELYDLLNKTSQSKATALGELRKLSIERAKAGASSVPADKSSTAVTTTTSNNKPSVKPGFLNKGGSGGDKKGGNDGDNGNSNKGVGFVMSTMKNWYGRVTGPDSIAMKTAFWAVVTKDFWLFFGSVGFMHFRGNVLSLPPPV